jgi:hypothetical protein
MEGQKIQIKCSNPCLGDPRRWIRSSKVWVRKVVKKQQKAK